MVTGGHDFDQEAFALMVLDKAHTKRPVALLIEGGSQGADRIAREWAIGRGIMVETFDAEWEKFGKHARRIRNAQMLRKGCPDFVVAFAGNSGTRHMIHIATQAGMPVVPSWRHLFTIKRRVRSPGFHLIHIKKLFARLWSPTLVAK